ncbi:MAG: DUF3108 domain-containing protein [Burkholderiales bacterium]|nr:DUF3108 domain-containing protein [Burkholderiales bacterium]
MPATANFPAASLSSLVLRLAEAEAGARTRRVLQITLVLSLLVHIAFTWWPYDPPLTPESTPLTATITELPPPPKPSAPAPPAPKPKAKPKPKRSSPIAAPQPSPIEATPEAVPAETAASADTAAAADAETTAKTAEADAAVVIPGAATGLRTLPPRIDLAYKVFWGTRGFMIGDAVYRFEHANHRYRIATVGEARGLAALVLRGQGKLESRGVITDEGLQPQILRIERGGPDRVETAVFDWEAGIVTMHDNSTASLDLPTFDPLSLMWQYYFTPPTADVVHVSVATPRRLTRYTITREATEKIEWPNGTIDAERWHRRSDDGKTDAYIWLAPSLRHIPVKMRISHTERGTIEVLLDAIRVDEAAVISGREELAMPRAEDVAPEHPQARPPAYNEWQPAATFPTMTGQ